MGGKNEDERDEDEAETAAVGDDAPDRESPAAKDDAVDKGKTQEKPKDEAKPSDVEALRKSLTKLEAVVKDRNKENRKLRQRLDRYESGDEPKRTDVPADVAQLREDLEEEREARQAAEQRAAAAEQALTELRVRHAIEREAAKQGAIYPDTFPGMVDRSAIEVDDETHKITGVKDAVKAFIEAHPRSVDDKSAGNGTPNRDGVRRRGGDADRKVDDRRDVEDEMIGLGGYVH